MAAGKAARSAAETMAAGWPQYRGPQASGIDDRALAPTMWNVRSGENIRWQIPIPGLAHSPPIVWSDHLYLTTAVHPKGAEFSLDRTAELDAARKKEPHQWRLLAIDRLPGKSCGTGWLSKPSRG